MPRELWNSIKQGYRSCAIEMREAARQFQRLPDLNPVIVYSMRKVGSTSVTNALRGLGCDVYKQHCINPTVNSEIRRKLSRTGAPAQHWLVDGVRFSRRLASWRNYRRATSHGGKLKIFTFVKDPLSIALSDYFMQIFEFMPDVARRLDLERPDNVRVHFRAMIESSVSGQSSDPMTEFLAGVMRFPHEWFETELKAATGIDVLSTEFPAARGFEIYRGEDSEVALIRTDKIDSVATEAIECLIGKRPNSLRRMNVREQTRHGALYRALVEDPQLPKELVRAYYRQPWLHHFFTAEEKELMERRWTCFRS